MIVQSLIVTEELLYRVASAALSVIGLTNSSTKEAPLVITGKILICKVQRNVHGRQVFLIYDFLESENSL
jgi:hypothetical protein